MKRNIPNVPVPLSLLRSTRFLAALGGISMISTGELEILFVAVFLGLFFLGFQVVRFRGLSLLVSWVEPYMAAFVFLVALVDFFFLSNSFLVSGAHFLLALQGLRLLVVRTPRENMGSILLSTLMMLSASTLAVEWTFFVLLLIFLPAILWTLILHNAVLESGEDVRIPMWSIRVGTGMSVTIAVLCCVVTFILLPRINFRQWRGEFLQPVHKTGFAKQVDLNESGRIVEDESIVMRVEISKEQRRLWSGYLRGPTLDQFDGKIWRGTPSSKKRIYNQGLQGIHVPPEWIGKGERFLQKIYLESMESPVLFAAPRPFVFRIDRPFISVGKDGTFRRAFGDGWRCYYEVESLVSRPFDKQREKIVRQFDRAMGMGEEAEKFLQLDGDFQDIRDRAQEITQGSQTSLEIAERLSQVYSTQYQYTLDFGRKTEKDPLRNFIFESKQGHCEYFASAMCVMLRSLGIPSRLVTGFYSQEWNERGHYVVVRMRHAHSWLEAFVEPYGWIEFDPSPLQWTEPRLQASWVKRLQDYTDTLNLAWNRYILSYDIMKQIEIVRSLRSRSRRVSNRWDGWLGKFQGKFEWDIFRSENKQRGGGGGRSLPLQIVFPFVLVFFGGGVFLLIWALFRREKLSSVWFYGKLLSYLEKKGGPKDHHQTLNEFITTLKDKLNGTTKDVQFLSQEYHRLRFHPNLTPTPPETQKIRAALKRLK